jgi:hypothetical protein
MSTPAATSIGIDVAIRRWVLEACDKQEDAPLIEQLRETVLAIARAHLASGPTFPPPRHLDAEDLAIEFLISLRKQGNWKICTKTGLATEYRSWVAEFSNPAQHELWEIVSTALHALARESVAWRLDAPASDDNHNDAVWTGVAGAAGSRPCDLLAFEKAARLIRNYAPPAARKWCVDGAILPKVIAPKDAKELTLALLHAAGGAIRLRDLLEEFKRHVFAFDSSSEIDKDHTASPLSIHPLALTRIYDLAHERAALIWEATSAISGTDLLCDYFIPKHLEERPVILEEFGDPRRVYERMQLVVQYLRQHLALNLAEALDVEDDTVDTARYGRDKVVVHGGFVREAMHILCEKCGCRPGKTPPRVLPI